MKNETATESVIERIRKLLNMTTENGCSEAEAHYAANLAQKLCLQHGLEVSAMGEKPSEENSWAGMKSDRGVRAGSGWKVKFDWCCRLAAGVSENFCCKLLVLKGKPSVRHNAGHKDFDNWTSVGSFTIIGREDNVDIAKDVYNFLFQQIRWMGWYARDQKQAEVGKDRVPKNYLDDFWHGCVTRVNERLRIEFARLQAEDTSIKSYVLETVDLTETYLLQKYPHLRRRNRARVRLSYGDSWSAAYSDGIEAGNQVKLKKELA